jgi:2-polyprenyl-3-methyl-5-hydroxy-6-metoxy-1,4-benzoquinol methylase
VISSEFVVGTLNGLATFRRLHPARNLPISLQYWLVAYILGTDDRRRLDLLQQVHDPATIRELETLGSLSGWHCLDIGAGAGSIAVWLAQAVGNAGSVLATDLDTKFLEQLRLPNLKVARHDITSDHLPDSCFDLIHSRLLVHLLPQREKGVGEVGPGTQARWMAGM